MDTNEKDTNEVKIIRENSSLIEDAEEVSPDELDKIMKHLEDTPDDELEYMGDEDIDDEEIDKDEIEDEEGEDNDKLTENYLSDYI